MAAQDWWLSEANALNIIRCKHREPDDVLRKMLWGAAGLLGLQTMTLPDGTQIIVKAPEPPSGGWPIRWEFQHSHGFKVPFFFRPDLEKWLDSIDKPAAKPTKKPTKRFVAKELQGVRTLLEAHKTDGSLSYRAGEKLVKDHYGDKFPREIIRNLMRDAGITISKPGRRSKISKAS